MKSIKKRGKVRKHQQIVKLKEKQSNIFKNKEEKDQDQKNGPRSCLEVL